MAAQGLSQVADHDRAGLGEDRLSGDRLSGRVLLRRAQEEGRARKPRRARSRDQIGLRQAGYPAGGAGSARRGEGRTQGRGGRGVRQRQRCHHLPRGTAEGGGDLPFDQRGDPRAPGTGQEVARPRGPAERQLLRLPQLGGLFRRHLRLHPRRRALPDGTLHLFPHQCGEHRPVRTHADRCRKRLLRQLPRRLHRADARREPAARRGGRAGRDGRCGDQVFDRAELVSRQRRRRRRDLQFRDQARAVSGRALQDQLDAGRDRLCGDVEVSELRAER